MGEKTHISLREFVRTGCFGPISLGMNTSHVLAAFGEPDHEIGLCSPHDRQVVYRYGHFHLSFDNDELSAIHIEGVNECASIEGPKLASLDPWILRRDLPQCELERELREANIRFRTRPYAHQPGCGEVTVASRVRLVFLNYATSNDICSGLQRFGIESRSGLPAQRHIDLALPRSLAAALHNQARTRNISVTELCQEALWGHLQPTEQNVAESQSRLGPLD